MPVSSTIDLGSAATGHELGGDGGVKTLLAVGDVLQELLRLDLEACGALPEGMVLVRGLSSVSAENRRPGTHLGGIVGEAVAPDEVEVVLELALGLVLLRLDLALHRLEVHGMHDD